MHRSPINSRPTLVPLRGLGRAIAEALLKAGAKKVYATAREPKALRDLSERYAGRLVPLQLDVTNADHVARVAREASDVELLFNNAGVVEATQLTGESTVEQARREMEVNYFAPLALLQGFAAGLAVFGVYPGPVDTAMAKDLPMDKTSPQDVARSILDSIEAGREDIFPDAFSAGFGEQFHASPKASEQQVAAMVAEAPAA